MGQVDEVVFLAEGECFCLYQGQMWKGRRYLAEIAFCPACSLKICRLWSASLFGVYIERVSFRVYREFHLGVYGV